MPNRVKIEIGGGKTFGPVEPVVEPELHVL